MQKSKEIKANRLDEARQLVKDLSKVIGEIDSYNFLKDTLSDGGLALFASGKGTTPLENILEKKDVDVLNTTFLSIVNEHIRNAEKDMEVLMCARQ